MFSSSSRSASGIAPKSTDRTVSRPEAVPTWCPQLNQIETCEGLSFRGLTRPESASFRTFGLNRIEKGRGSLGSNPTVTAD